MTNFYFIHSFIQQTLSSKHQTHKHALLCSVQGEGPQRVTALCVEACLPGLPTRLSAPPRNYSWLNIICAVDPKHQSKELELLVKARGSHGI